MLALGAAKVKTTENRVPRVFDKVCSKEPHVEIHRPSLSGLHAALTLGGTYTSPHSVPALTYFIGREMAHLVSSCRMSVAFQFGQL